MTDQDETPTIETYFRAINWILKQEQSKLENLVRDEELAPEIQNYETFAAAAHAMSYLRKPKETKQKQSRLDVINKATNPNELIELLLATANDNKIATLFRAMDWLQNQNRRTLSRLIGHEKDHKDLLEALRIPTEKEEAFPLGYSALKYADREEYPEYPGEENSDEKNSSKKLLGQDVHVAVITSHIIAMMTDKDPKTIALTGGAATDKEKSYKYVPMDLFKCLSKLAVADERLREDFRRAFRSGVPEKECEFWPDYGNFANVQEHDQNDSDQKRENDFRILVRNLMQELAQLSPDKDKIRNSLGHVVETFVIDYGMVC